MLVVSNGAYKSGSSWLLAILRELIDFDPIPEAYRHLEYPQWLNPGSLTSFLENVDHQSKNLLIKAHLFDRHYVELLTSRSDVAVLDITRDLRDTIVSHYHHLVRESNIGQGFSRYYWTLGRLKAHEIFEYHRAWQVPSANVHVTSFEGLKNNFVAEVRRIVAFLGTPVSDERIREIQQETSINRLRQKRREDHFEEKDWFYRKGAIGGWKPYMTDRIVADLKRIEAGRLGTVGRIGYFLLFTGRRRIQSLMNPKDRVRRPRPS